MVGVADLVGECGGEMKGRWAKLKNEGRAIEDLAFNFKKIFRRSRIRCSEIVCDGAVDVAAASVSHDLVLLAIIGLLHWSERMQLQMKCSELDLEGANGELEELVGDG